MEEQIGSHQASRRTSASVFSGVTRSPTNTFRLAIFRYTHHDRTPPLLVNFGITTRFFPAAIDFACSIGVAGSAAFGLFDWRMLSPLKKLHDLRLKPPHEGGTHALQF
ncbi:MAG: hypothetical protein KIT73_14725 [Burkholderiales bacterium]|nr:hypothetical protein [Burkholderiales bacterium]